VNVTGRSKYDTPSPNESVRREESDVKRSGSEADKLVKTVATECANCCKPAITLWQLPILHLWRRNEPHRHRRGPRYCCSYSARACAVATPRNIQDGDVHIAPLID